MRNSFYTYRTSHAKLSAQEFPPDHFYTHFRLRCQERRNNGDNERINLVIKDMGEEVGLPPCLMARFVIKSFVHVYSLEGNGTDSTLDESEDMDTHNNLNNSSKMAKAATARITKILREPESIQSIDPILSYNLHYCCQNDFLTSPLSDQYRQKIGIEKEDYMHDRLRDMGILFLSEAAMRAAGYPKTPDALLAYPVEINGHIVNWIESKALFSDGSTHQNYLRGQYWPYYNRFGPGLVIYWFGFLEEINSEREKEKGILVMDKFPEIINKIKY